MAKEDIERGGAVKAEVGDELIIPDGSFNEPGRIGTIVAVPNQDGSPPYRVRWLVGEYESLVHLDRNAQVRRRRRSPRSRPE